jgi:hypothetical protein
VTSAQPLEPQAETSNDRFRSHSFTIEREVTTIEKTKYTTAGPTELYKKNDRHVIQLTPLTNGYWCFPYSYAGEAWFAKDMDAVDGGMPE